MYKLLSACDVHMTRGTISLSLEQVAHQHFSGMVVFVLQLLTLELVV
jgi:hypothetical protein